MADEILYKNIKDLINLIPQDELKKKLQDNEFNLNIELIKNKSLYYLINNLKYVLQHKDEYHIQNIESQIKKLVNYLDHKQEIAPDKLKELNNLNTLDSNLFILLFIVFNNIKECSLAKIKLLIYYLTVKKFNKEYYTVLILNNILLIDINNNIDINILKQDKIILVDYLKQIITNDHKYINLTQLFNELKFPTQLDIIDEVIIKYFFIINPFLIQNYLENYKSLNNITNINKILTKVLYNNGLDLRYIPKEQLTETLILIAINENWESLQYIITSSDDKKQFLLPELVKKAVQKNGLALQLIPENLKTSDLVKIAVHKNGLALRYVPEDLKTLELVKIAVQNNGLAIEYVPENFKNNKDIIILALQNNGSALAYVPEKFKNDINCVKIAINNIGEAIYYVPEQIKMQLNEDDYYNIVRRYGLGLKYIPENKKNKKIIEAAIKENPYALRFVSDNLLQDINIQIVTDAIKENPELLLNLTDEIKKKIKI